jgi:hypothetical protein
MDLGIMTALTVPEARGVACDVGLFCTENPAACGGSQIQGFKIQGFK